MLLVYQVHIDVFETHTRLHRHDREEPERYVAGKCQNGVYISAECVLAELERNDLRHINAHTCTHAYAYMHHTLHAPTYSDTPTYAHPRLYRHHRGEPERYVAGKCHNGVYISAEYVLAELERNDVLSTAFARAGEGYRLVLVGMWG